MIFTSRMVYLTAVTLQQYTDAVAKALLSLGLMHFVDIREVAPRVSKVDSSSLKPAGEDEERTVSAEARRRIETLLDVGGLQRPTVSAGNIQDEAHMDPDEIHKMADGLSAKVDDIREQQRRIQQQINRLEDVQRHIPSTGSATLKDLSSFGSSGTFLVVRTGTVPASRLETLDQKIAKFPAVLTHLSDQGDQAFVILVGMKRNASELDEILQAQGFQKQEIPQEAATETRANVDRKLAKLRTEQRNLANSIHETMHGERPNLEQAWRAMRVRELVLTIEGQFSDTKRATVVSGWIPESERDNVQAALKSATEGHLHTEWHVPKDLEKSSPVVPVPSRLENPTFLRPFQILVTNYGTPAYGTIDPTPLVTAAYLIMFGLMFGDAGHGLVLVLLGLLGIGWSKRQAPSATGSGIAAAIPTLSRLVLWCGSASIVTGILFGSYFGYSILPPVWFDYHGVVAGHVDAGPVRSIFDILRITIIFGVAVIALGLVTNWINLARQGKWFPLVFDKAGILGGIIYAAGVYAAAQFAMSGFRTIEMSPWLAAAILGPAVLLFLKSPLEGHSKNPLWWVMEWVIELLEVFSGYLANTLSFMRVAGLGIAHVTLMIAFFQIAEMASPEGTNLWAVIILLLGNVLVIALEGLSAGIQSLRLNYYEFFSKHFQASGTPYRPISLEETP